MSEKKGYIFMLLVVIMHSLPAIAVKFIYTNTNVYTTQMLWFMSSSIWSLVFLAKKGKKIIKNIKKHFLTLILFGFANAAGILGFFYGLIYVSPSVLAFLDRFSTIFSIILGVIILKESFNKKESIGMILSMLGVFVLSFSTNPKIAIASLIYLGGSLIYAFGFVIVKKNSKNIDPYTFMFFRSWFIFILMSILTFSTKNYQQPSNRVIPLFIIVPLFSAVIAQILQYKSFTYIGIGKSSLIKNLQPITTAILAFFILGDILNTKELIGGSIVVIGLTIMILFRKSKIKNILDVKDEI